MSISITDQDVFTALRTFLIGVLPNGTEVVQAQDNYVSMPDGPFVTMNNVSKTRLATNIDSYTYSSPILGTKDLETKTQFVIQLDFYGPDSGDWAQIVQCAYRDEYATSVFPANIQPLYADDPMQIPLIDGEQNYTQRWKLKAVMQYNPIVSLTQQFADQINISSETIADLL